MPTPPLPPTTSRPQTGDGLLLATHPDDLAAAVAPPAGRQLGEMSVAELRAAGADEDRFPTAEGLIKVGGWVGAWDSTPCKGWSVAAECPCGSAGDRPILRLAAPSMQVFAAMLEQGGQLWRRRAPPPYEE